MKCVAAFGKRPFLASTGSVAVGAAMLLAALAITHTAAPLAATPPTKELFSLGQSCGSDDQTRTRMCGFAMPAALGAALRGVDLGTQVTVPPGLAKTLGARDVAFATLAQAAWTLPRARKRAAALVALADAIDRDAALSNALSTLLGLVSDDQIVAAVDWAVPRRVDRILSRIARRTGHAALKQRAQRILTSRATHAR